jgi:hypothetical protein
MRYFFKILLTLISIVLFSLQSKCQNISSRYFYSLPREVELQGQRMKEGVNSLRDSINMKVDTNLPRLKLQSSDIEIIQQLGLNDRVTSAYKTYFRYSVGSYFEYGSPIEYDEIKQEFNKDIKGTSILFANILKNNIEKSDDCDGGCNFSIINGDTCLIDDYISIPLFFNRKSKVKSLKGEELVSAFYIIPTIKKIYFIRYTYLKIHEASWLPIVKHLNNSISLSGIYGIPGIKNSLNN